MRYAISWMDAQIGAIRDVTPTVREFLIVPDGDPPLRYAVGSHVNVGVLVDGRPDTRSYSLVGEPRADCYRIAVKLSPESRGGSAYMWSLKAGSRLTITEPRSLFEIDYDRPEYLLIAGGIGITPMLGMAQTLARRGEKVRMLYGARNPEELAFESELRQIPDLDLRIFTDSSGERMDLVSEFASLHPRGLVAVCGPLPMLDACRRAWKSGGRKAVDMRYETFGNSGEHAAEVFRVRVADRDIEVVVPESQSMLDSLEQAGVAMMYDCRRGECGLCAVTILDLQGKVDHRDVFFSDEQKHENQKICACVSRVIGSITIDTSYCPNPAMR